MKSPMTSHATPRAASVPPEGFLSGFAALSARYPIVFSDVWGVVHDGVRAFPEACAALERHRAAGGVVVLITNAPRPSGPLRLTLDDYGAPRSCYDDMVSSGDVTVGLMAERGATPAHFIGPERDLALFSELAARGAPVPDNVPVSEAGYSVVSGLRWDDTETPADYEAELAAMRARDLLAISANPDIVVHRGERLLYCGGALARRYEEMGGRVIQAGKPYPPIYAMAQAAARAAQRARGLPEGGATLCIGDALATDVAGAAAQGYDCLYVADGIHRDEYLDAAGAIDAAALETFLSGAVRPPVGVMRRLVW